MCERRPAAEKRPAHGLVAHLLIGAITLYRYTISAILGRQCRFLPTCSEYAAEAIRRHGAWRGSVLALTRIARCNPWGGEGFDPVPDMTQGAWWDLKKIVASRTQPPK
ncbi:MAG: membrane protein insertion efficiency factor YidD [Rhizobiales bacterium]|nr:membrane protein insertion efficiency factor YidD [Hyphomicrobiales bacterium]